MRHTLRRTREGLAIVPGLLLCGLLLSACEERSGPSTENIALCLAETTPIETVQGDSWRSPLEGTRQTVGGVVTVVDQQVGFYLEQGQRENPQRSGGLFIESEMPLDLDEQVQLQFRLPGIADPIKVNGRVAWIREAGAGGPPGMGVEFENLDANARLRIDEIVQALRVDRPAGVEQTVRVATPHPRAQRIADDRGLLE